MRLAPPFFLFATAALAACVVERTKLPDKPLDIEVKITAEPPGFSRDKRIPITFDSAAAVPFTIDLRVRNYDGSTRTTFTGPNAWVRLTFSPAGQIVESEGPKGKNDPDVAGANIHLTNGEIKGVKLRVIGAYGDTRIVAQDVGFVPGPTAGGKLPACADGVDNDNNGYADYPHDPHCLYLNDDAEVPFEAGFGTSRLLHFEHPTIRDVQLGTASPFIAKQVDLRAFPTRRLVVTGVVNNGMYVTDLDEKEGSGSIFVFTFSAPFGIQACDTLTRLSGNVADFFGGTQLGTPGWTVVPWLDERRSGPCPIPDFVQIDGTFAGIVEKVEALESALVTVKEPIIGTHFGREKVPVVEGRPQPQDGKSNCDLNGDGIVGFNANRGGFSPLEKACNDACSDDPDCTEWNNFVQFNQVKIKFQPGDATLFFSPSAVPGFDVLQFVGPNKLAEARGVLTNFVGPRPPYSIEPRCSDDIVPFGADPKTIKTAKTACVRGRIGIDVEGQN